MPSHKHGIQIQSCFYPFSAPEYKNPGYNVICCTPTTVDSISIMWVTGAYGGATWGYMRETDSEIFFLYLITVCRSIDYWERGERFSFPSILILNAMRVWNFFTEFSWLVHWIEKSMMTCQFGGTKRKVFFRWGMFSDHGWIVLSSSSLATLTLRFKHSY